MNDLRFNPIWWVRGISTHLPSCPVKIVPQGLFQSHLVGKGYFYTCIGDNGSIVTASFNPIWWVRGISTSSHHGSHSFQHLFQSHLVGKGYFYADQKLRRKTLKWVSIPSGG